jgi:ATP-binding cassette subfamily B multidrug efflux pump
MSEHGRERQYRPSPPRRRGMGFGPGHGVMMGEKARDFKGTMRRLLKNLSVYWPSLIIVSIFAIASTVFTILGPDLMGRVTTSLFEGIMDKVAGRGDGIDFGYISQVIIRLCVLYGLSALFAHTKIWVMSGISMKISYRFRRDISEKINRLPLKYFDATNHGEVLSRVTNDVDTLSHSLNQSLTSILSSITTVVGVLYMMLRISLLLTVVSFLILPISSLIVAAIIKRSQKYFVQQQQYLGHVNGHVEEMYSGHTVMKAFNGEEKSMEKFGKLNGKLYEAGWKSHFLSGMMMPAMSFVGNIGYVLVSVLGGWLAVRGSIEVGQIQAFIQYNRSFMQPIVQLGTISTILQQTAASAERIFEFLEEEEKIPETTNPVKLEDVQGSVEFKGVSFGYDPEKIVINNFNASIRPGQKVAIVGPTGAGKTTIVKLLMRYYDVNEGTILVDGHDIREFTRHDLRSIFGMVLQDTWLYNGTILDNIRYGRLDATDAEVIEAAKAAHVDSFVHMLPDGYNMILNEEASNVSQGQKQLITIARAILADPSILILDEATSSVDTRTEVQIQRAMDTL